MIAGGALVQQQLRLLTIIAHQNVEVSVVINISHSRPAAHARELKIRSELVAQVIEGAATVIAVEKLRLRVARLRVV
jgi:hypothetical protein